MSYNALCLGLVGLGAAAEHVFSSRLWPVSAEQCRAVTVCIIVPSGSGRECEKTTYREIDAGLVEGRVLSPAVKSTSPIPDLVRAHVFHPSTKSSSHSPTSTTVRVPHVWFLAQTGGGPGAQPRNWLSVSLRPTQPAQGLVLDAPAAFDFQGPSTGACG